MPSLVRLDNRALSCLGVASPAARHQRPPRMRRGGRSLPWRTAAVPAVLYLGEAVIVSAVVGGSDGLTILGVFAMFLPVFAVPLLACWINRRWFWAIMVAAGLYVLPFGLFAGLYGLAAGPFIGPIAVVLGIRGARGRWRACWFRES